MSDFPVTAAQIVALFSESVLYGVYLVTLFHCLRALLWSESDGRFKSQINWSMLIPALLLCLFATLDVAFGLRHLLDAFVYYQGPGGPAEELSDISYWVNVMKIYSTAGVRQTVDSVAQTYIGDAILVYRCYCVYGRNWRYVILSILLWIGGVVTFATLKTAALIDTTKAVPYSISFFTFTISLNVITTSLIIYRIWKVDRETAQIVTISSSRSSRRHMSRLHSIMRILVESAALYTISVIIFVITYAVNNNGNYVASDNVVPIIGISFNLIIIRVDSGRAYEGTATYKSSIAFRAPLKLPLTTQRSQCDMDGEVSMGPLTSKDHHRTLEINVEREVSFATDAGHKSRGVEEEMDLGEREGVQAVGRTHWTAL
ncbi:hypothetical protein F5I97DRAFT_1934143 [Phlebopus sp. FC_14]|nr:hypothetical protein F5I97DRAFT_1934143 [Phlebopus sp. FC_14]